MEWYYAKDGNQEGPVSAAQLRQLAVAGKLTPTDMVFKVGSKDWVEASTVSGLFPAGRSAPAAAPPADEGGFAFGGEGEKVSAAPSRRKAVRERVEEDEPQDDEDAPRPRRAGGGSMGDLLMFRRMVTPWVIMVIFWIGVAGAVGYGLFMIGLGFLSGTAMGIVFGLLAALIAVPISVLMVRLYCEFVMVIFRMNETLTDIKNVLERQRTP